MHFKHGNRACFYFKPYQIIKNIPIYTIAIFIKIHKKLVTNEPTDL